MWFGIDAYIDGRKGRWLSTICKEEQENYNAPTIKSQKAKLILIASFVQGDEVGEQCTTTIIR